MRAEPAQVEAILDRLTRLHGELADQLEAQRDALRRADGEALARLGVRIETSVRRIAEQEARRRESCGWLAEALGLGARRVRVSELARRLGGPAGARLDAAARRLRVQMDRVSRANRINESLTSRLTDFCGELLGRIARAERQTGNYDGRGQMAVSRHVVLAATGFSAVG